MKIQMKMKYREKGEESDLLTHESFVLRNNPVSLKPISKDLTL